MGSRYVHSSLDSTRREVRLLRLLPGSWDEPLLCELNAVSLNDKPEFQGLSYVWGKSGIVKTVQLDGKPFQVSLNLWTALRRLRRLHDERVIWADAACINQNDLEERSYQVALMGEIYSNASHTFIWLGDSISAEGFLESSPGALHDGKDINWIRDNIDRLFKSPTFPDDESEALAAFGVFYLLSLDEHWTVKPLFTADREGRYHVADRYVVAWQAALKLLQLPWWSRVWVVQEAALAKSATVVLGSVSIPWGLFFQFCRSYIKHLPPGACCHSSAAWKMTSALWDDIVLMRLTVWSFYTVRAEMELPLSRPAHTAFWKILWLLRHKKATDPRDKVYSLLGLLYSHRQPLLIPDYSMSTGETFSSCTEALIKFDDNLNALVGPRLRQRGLPTWVIDFLPQEDSVSVLFFQNIFKRISSSIMFNACRMQQLSYSLSASKLSLHGIDVDTVVCTAMAGEDGLVAQAFNEWETLAGLTDEHRASVYPSGCTPADAFWRTMIRDTIRDYQDGEKTRRAIATDKLHFMNFRGWLTQQGDTDSAGVMADLNFHELPQVILHRHAIPELLHNRQGLHRVRQLAQDGRRSLDTLWRERPVHLASIF